MPNPLTSSSFSSLKRILSPLVEHRFLLSCGLSIACGIVLQSLYPIHSSDPVLRLIALKRPPIYEGLIWSYTLFLYTTPFLALSILFSFAYIHLYAPDMERSAGPLPHYPDPRSRRDLFLIFGETHHPLKPAPSHAPQWMAIPQRGLYTGISVIGAIGSEKLRPLSCLRCASYSLTRPTTPTANCLVSFSKSKVICAANCGRY